MLQSVKKSVVIVGGGHSGTALARILSSKLDPSRYELLLINPRPYSIWLPAMIRTVITPKQELEKKAFMPYDKLFSKNGRVVHGKVTAIQKKEGLGGTLVLHNHDDIHYDILVLATGSIWEGHLSFPDDEKDVKTHLQNMRRQFSDAKDIVLVGGGAIGIETAGEIKGIYPGTNVTIVHGDSKLLNPSYPDKVRNTAEQKLRAKGINLVLGDYIDDLQPVAGHVKTRHGKQLKGDLILSARGGRPNPNFVQSLGEGTLTPAGYVKVNNYLQVQGHADIFAVGDILDRQEQKQAAKVHGHAAVVAKNIVSLLNGQSALKEYARPPEIILLTTGKDGGVTYFGFLWGLMFGNWVTYLLKSKDLLIPMARKGMGLKN